MICFVGALKGWIVPLFVVPGTVNSVVPARRYFACGSQSKHSGLNAGWGPAAESAKTSAANKATPVNQQTDVSSDSSMCMNVAGDAFAKLIMGLRDDALGYVISRRAELLRWDEQAKQRTRKWFDSSDDEIRLYLLPLLDSVARVLRGLSPKNFLDETDENLLAARCVRSAKDDGTGNVSVCPTDTTEHRIFVNTPFFSKSKYGFRFGTTSFDGRDSQLLALIHEVTHYNDVASSSDEFYGASNALMHSKRPGAKKNADSLAAYILGMEITSRNFEGLVK